MNPALGNTLPSDALPPKRATFGGRMARKRCFQEGSLFKRGTRKKVWVARWWEPVIGPDNMPGRIRRSEVLGTVAEIPTMREARQMLSRSAAQGQQRRISAASGLDISQICGRPMEAGRLPHVEVLKQEVLRQHGQHPSHSGLRKHAIADDFEGQRPEFSECESPGRFLVEDGQAHSHCDWLDS